MTHDRRSLLRIAAGALALPIVSARPARAQPLSGASSIDPAGSGPVAFMPPEGPMLYSRTLQRELVGGANITVTRNFTIRFSPNGAGFRIDGEEVGVEVTAPESLAMFADLERERRELGLFPLLLDASGQIDGGTEPVPAQQLDRAVQEVLARISSNSTEEERRDLRQFAVAVHQNATALLSQLPRDLFVPLVPQLEETRPVALPDGGEGLVTVVYATQTDGTGLMRSASREIVTLLAESRRRTIESWTLTPRA